MYDKLTRLSQEMKLPDDSRGRIRASLSSHQPTEENMKKLSFKTRAPLIAAVIAILALTVTAGAAVIMTFRNDIIVSSKEDVFDALEEQGEGGAVAISSPIASKVPSTLEEITENDRFKTDDWDKGERINGGILTEYFEWDRAEVLSGDPTLRSRLITRSDGAEKVEYTAENPINLLEAISGRVTIDLSWIDSHYSYVPDANLSYIVTDENGDYAAEYFQALYAKEDGKGWFRLSFENAAADKLSDRSYIIDSSYETSYYYTSTDGYEFLIKMNNGQVWVNCRMEHTSVDLYGAYLTQEDVENILDNLSLTVK